MGVHEKYLEWRPEVFLVAAFGGTGFSEQLAMANLFGESVHFGLTPLEEEKRALANGISPCANGQTYSSLYRFFSHPDRIEPPEFEQVAECPNHAVAASDGRQKVAARFAGISQMHLVQGGATDPPPLCSLVFLATARFGRAGGTSS